LPCFSLIYSAEQKIFADDFAKSLSQFDELLLLEDTCRELPPWKELRKWLLGKSRSYKNKKLISRDVISGVLEVMLRWSLGAGEICEN
jgi:UDP-N-acetylmuramate--alanine ligase